METCGQRVKRLREARKLSQRGLGKLCGCAGPTIADLESWETKFPSARVLQKMSEVFGVSDRYILYGEDGDIKELTQEQHEWLARIERLTPEQREAAKIILEQINTLTR